MANAALLELGLEAPLVHGLGELFLFLLAAVLASAAWRSLSLKALSRMCITSCYQIDTMLIAELYDPAKKYGH